MNKQRFSYIFAILAVLAITLFASSTTQTPSNQQSDSTFVVVRPIYMPDSVSLFGERVPLENFDVYESLERELLVNVFYHSQTTMILKYVHRYFPTIDSILAANNIPADFKYLAVAESGLRVNISPKGAAGFWQLLEQTAKQYGITVTDDIDQRYDLEKSTEVACKYLKNAYNKFGNWTMTAASYNLGINGLAKQADYQQITSFYDLYTNSETARYVFRVLAFKLIIENPELFGYQDLKPYATIKTNVLCVDTAIADLQAFARSQGSNYKMLKTQNPWLRAKHLPNPNGVTYKITLIDESERNLNNAKQ